MSYFREFRTYSPLADCITARLSMVDERGSEFYMMLPVGTGKPYRLARRRALEAIGTAIDTGLPPGEVTIADE